jgi:hypothetical protein
MEEDMDDIYKASMFYVKEDNLEASDLQKEVSIKKTKKPVLNSENILSREVVEEQNDLTEEQNDQDDKKSTTGFFSKLNLNRKALRGFKDKVKQKGIDWKNKVFEEYEGRDWDRQYDELCN